MGDPTGFKLTLDFDHGTVGFSVADVLEELQDVVGQLFPAAPSALGWLPDSGETAVGFQVDLNSGTMSGDVAVSTEQGEPLATAIAIFEPGAGAEQRAVEISLDKQIDLSGTPLFGGLLSGVRVTDLAVSYANQPIPPGTVRLPDGSSGPAAAIGQDFGLSLTLLAGGSTQSLQLASQPPDSASSAAAAHARSVRASPADEVVDRGRIATEATAAAPTPATMWFPVQKTFGPLSVDRIGIVLGSGTVGLALDAGLNTSVVGVTLTGFVVRLAKSPTSVSVDLDGLAVNVSSGSLEIAGSLIRTILSDGVEYDGSLIIRVAQYAINAAGSYGTIAGSPSLFVFGLAQGEFGGPPMFFVTGLAAGFGINRALRLPAPDEVRTFPLIQAATQGPAYLPAGGVTGTQDALAKLASGGWVPPTVGEYWVAAGVAFRSFELVNGFALVVVQFGREFSIALLGIAALKLPTPTDGGPVFAYAEITLEAVLEPAAGTFSLNVLLSPNSYVISPDCHLTGGLALDIWFGANPHAGDFVFTLGGYHSQFTRPAWYPTVPRLGFEWQMGDAIRISGESYFAITPSCAMGGGRLSLTFDVGDLHAWLIAQADFIMYWRPFWFDLDMMVSIGISYTVSFALVSATFSVNLGVAIELWGPPLRGTAHVNWFVVSFDIPINGGGSPTPAASTLADWKTFAATSLPSATAAGTPAAVLAGTPAATSSTEPAVCRARAVSGLLGMVDLAEGASLWLFGGDGVSVSSETAVPATTVTVMGPTAQTRRSLAGLPVHIYPLGNVTVASAHTVAVAAWTGSTWTPGGPLPAALDVSGWSWTLDTQNMPAALWAARGDNTQPSLGSAVVPGVVGLTGVAPAPAMPGALVTQTAVLMDDELPARGLLLETTAVNVTGPVQTGDTRSRIAASLVDPVVVQTRSAIVQAAAKYGFATGLTSDPLGLFSGQINAVLTAPAMIGPLGITGPAPIAAQVRSATQQGKLGSTSAAGPVAGPVAALGLSDAGVSHPVLRALFRQQEPAAPHLHPAQRTPSAVAHVMDRFSGRLDRHDATDRASARPAGTERSSGQQPTESRLWPGWTAVWDLQGDGFSLRTSASGDLHMVALDAGQQIIEFRSLPDDAEIHPMPPNATRVAVSHAPRSSPATSMGWSAHTRLRQIASQTFIGAGILVRSQSPSAVGGRRSRQTLGVRTARDVIHRNWTIHGGAEARYGWIDTWLPASCRTLAVTMFVDGRDGTSTGVPQPTVTLRSAHHSIHGSTRRQVAKAWDGTVLTTWFYALDRQESDEPAVVRVQTPPGWRLDGVVGIRASRPDLQNWHPHEALGVPSPGPGRAAVRVGWR